jgi:hypothetical protein
MGADDLEAKEASQAKPVLLLAACAATFSDAARNWPLRSEI